MGSRTVTFVLGDVVGSTRIWADQPEAMREALATLDALVDEAARQHDGDRPVEQGEGDSFVLMFPRAVDAIAGALHVQRALRDGKLAVRIAIHTGDAEERPDGRWIGPSLNRCARIRALAHGGQVLVSAATAAVVIEDLPDGATLRDLGRHRLKDLARPEDIRQLCHPGLVADFPPLASLDRFPHNLPVELSSFVGRDTELGELAGLLDRSRLVTLTGAGGAGKTRLAVHLAGRYVEECPAGVWLADLAGTGDPTVVPAVVAAAMRIPEQPLQAVLDTIVAYLRDDAALLVLDNCEHLLGACAAIADHLLRSCRAIRILATSREPLGVEGELVYRVPSLEEADAVRLFVERAQAVRASFALDSTTDEPVRKLCTRLDGLPLGIELAAARVRMMAPREIVEQLTGRLQILSAGRPAALPRQRTIEASVQWSYDLLNEAERRLLQSLSVFAGGFTLRGAEQVGAQGSVEEWEIVELLAGLVDKSLVQVEDNADRTRYRLLETVRVFASQRLADSGELESTRDRHLAFVTKIAESMEESFVAQAVGTFAQIELELDNIRAALDWAVSANRHDAAWRLGAATGPWWEFHHQEGARRLIDIAELPGGDCRDRVLLLVWASVCFLGGDFASAESLCTRALVEAADDAWLGGIASNFYSFVLLLQGDVEGRRHAELAIERLTPLGPSFWLSDALGALGIWHIFAGHTREALAVTDEALRVAAACGSDYGQATAEALRALFCCAASEFDEAQAAADRAIHVIQSFPPGMVSQLLGVVPAWTASAAGRHDEAVLLARAVLDEAHRFSLFALLALGGWVLSLVGLRAGEPRDEEALDEAEAIASAAGLPYGPAMLRAIRAEHALNDGDLATAAIYSAEAEASADASVLAGWAWPVTRRTAARVALTHGDLPLAEHRAHDALGRHVEMGQPWGVAEALETLAAVATRLDRPLEAARLLGGAHSIRARVGWAVGRPEQRELEALHASLHDQVGDADFDFAFGEGAAMSEADVVAYALRGRGERKRPSLGWLSLTPTESQVVPLVAEGLRNREIAKKLFISEATVKTHLTHIFTKLGVTSRAQLMAQATQRRDL